MEMNNRRNGKTARGLFRFSLLTAAAVYVINISGFVDTLTGSVTGCGQSWPLCHGTLTPWSWDWHAWIEFGHRFLVLIMTVMALSVSVLAWRRHRENRSVRVWIMLAALGILLESFLGALSVFAINPPALMATHMGVALLSFGAMIALTVTLWQSASEPGTVSREKTRSADRIVRLARWSLAYLYADIYVGAFVSSSGAGGAFRGAFLPKETFAEVGRFLLIDIAHRSLAVGLVLLTLRLAWLSFRQRRQLRGLYKGSFSAALLVVAQAFSGMLLVVTHLSFAAVLLHVSTVSLLFGVLVFLSVQKRAAGRAAEPLHSKERLRSLRPLPKSMHQRIRAASVKIRLP